MLGKFSSNVFYYPIQFIETNVATLSGRGRCNNSSNDRSNKSSSSNNKVTTAAAAATMAAGEFVQKLAWNKVHRVRCCSIFGNVNELPLFLLGLEHR